ncbi:MAG: hypothetical protein JSV03_12560 [Planctomycetota bacterium]|nr:MAG: hypothetical protein JSV03_12560 [Planctomycetota bacterium]
MKTVCMILGLCAFIPGIAQSNCTEVPAPAPTPTATPTPMPSPTPTPTPNPTQEIIIDNLDSEFSIVAGTWGTADTTDGSGCYGPDFRYHIADRINIGIARFTPTVMTTGSYTVYIYWSADPNRTAAQPVIVHDASGDTTYYVNLQQSHGQWYQLGSHTFNTGTDGYIEFNTDTGAGGYCNADAVRLVSEF